jgi:hypothetical protein
MHTLHPWSGSFTPSSLLFSYFRGISSNMVAATTSTAAMATIKLQGLWPWPSRRPCTRRWCALGQCARGGGAAMHPWRCAPAAARPAAVSPRRPCPAATRRTSGWRCRHGSPHTCPSASPPLRSPPRPNLAAQQGGLPGCGASTRSSMAVLLPSSRSYMATRAGADQEERRLSTASSRAVIGGDGSCGAVC